MDGASEPRAGSGHEALARRRHSSDQQTHPDPTQTIHHAAGRARQARLTNPFANMIPILSSLPPIVVRLLLAFGFGLFFAALL
jgi:hypothetical protein